MLAERQRRIGEAEESGQRQREERLRRIEDEIFKRMMRVHQGGVDTYLEDIILQSVERTADQQAREEIQQQADNINKIAHDFVHTYVQIKLCTDLTSNTWTLKCFVLGKLSCLSTHNCSIFFTK